MSRSRSLAVVAAVGFATLAALPAVASADSTYPTNPPLCSVGGSAVVSGVTSTDGSVTLSITGAGASQLVSISGSGSANVTHSSATTDASGNASVSEGVGSAGTATFTVTSSASSTAATCTVAVKTNPGGLASPSVQPATTTPAPATTSGGGSTGGTALPNTGGSDLFPLTIGGIALVATGVGLVAATRRRVAR